MLRTVKNHLKKTVCTTKSIYTALRYPLHIENETVAEKYLQTYSPDPGTSPLCRNQIFPPEYDLTVVIPVYNVESYVAECLASVLQQKTQYSFRVVAVNDGSTDGSGKILEQFSEWKNLSVITQLNMGSSGARNVALKEIRSEYIMFVDGDDLLTDGAIELLMCAAKEKQADIVQGGFVAFDSDSGKIRDVTRYEEEDHLPPNGVLAGMPWGKIYHASLFKNVCFPEGYIHQDTIITGIITHLAKNIATIPDMVCKYRLHKKSITSTVRVSPKAVHTLWVNLCVMQARQQLGLKTDEHFYMHLLRLVVLNQTRVRTQPADVQYAIFLLTRKMLRDSRVGLNLDMMDTKYKKLEKAILDEEYAQYLYLCGMW